MERIIKKYVYIYIDIFLYVEIKIHESKFYQMILFLIHELCDPSQPFDVHLISFPAQYFLHEMHVRMSSAMQLMLVKRSSDGFSAIILE